MQRLPSLPLFFLAPAWLAFSALCLSMPGEAMAQTYGKLFTKEQIYALSVQGFRLGMAQDEATALLKKNHWQGEWDKFQDPDVSSLFKKDNSRLYLMRCYGADKKLHLWAIVDKQVFNWPHYTNMPINRAIGDIWIDTVVDQFGSDSMEFSNPNGVNAYVYYLIDRKNSVLPKLEVYLNGYEATYELTDRTMVTSR